MAGLWWLLPGTLCTTEVFAPILEVLGIAPGQRRPVSLDRPFVEDYANDMAKVEPGDVVLGFSLGAILAAHHLDRIQARAVVLLAANPFADMKEKQAVRLKQLHEVSARGAGPVMCESWSSLVGSRAKKDGTLGKRIAAMAQATAPDLQAQTNLALSRPGAEPMLAAARSPVLFVTGSEDQAAPVARAQRAAGLGAHSITIIAGAGHFLPLEAPQACADAITNFLSNKG